MRNIESGIATLLSVVLISISAGETLASQRKAKSAKAGTGGQTPGRIGVTGNGSRGKALQEKMQNENRQTNLLTEIGFPKLRGTRGNADASKRRSAGNSVVDRDLDQPDMNASINEVTVESRYNSQTSTRRSSLFTPEVDDQVLLRKRGQPHKQPPSNRGPHKQPPTRRGPHPI
jgi:hypothetical protein